MPIEILGIRIDTFKKEEILSKISLFLSDLKQHTIFTPNPEMLVDAVKDKYFKEVLNSGSLNICDGKGIQFVSKEKIERIPGVDLMLEICHIAEKENKSVYFLGSNDANVLKNLTKNIKNLLPSLRIVGSNPGSKITMKQNNNLTILQVDESENDDILNEIIMKSPDILFVAFGHNKQEKWIYENLKQLPSVKIAMGVGGAFDFLADKKKRAPYWMQRIGLEWLYRLFQEPSRIVRIWRATVSFFFLTLKERQRLL